MDKGAQDTSAKYCARNDIDFASNVLTVVARKGKSTFVPSQSVFSVIP